MAPVAASPVTLLPAQRSVRSPFTGVPPKPLRMLGSGVNWLGNLVVGIALVFFLGLAVGPHLLGYRTETMLTGSMTPKIKVGDVVVASESPVHDLAVGDVISYRIPVEDHRVVTHRVVEIVKDPDGFATVRTKGDANSVEDPWAARITGRQVWRVHYVIPVIGKMIRFLREPVVARMLRFGAPALVILLALGGIWNRPAQPHPRDSPRTHDEQRARRGRHALRAGEHG